MIQEPVVCGIHHTAGRQAKYLSNHVLKTETRTSGNYLHSISFLFCFVRYRLAPLWKDSALLTAVFSALRPEPGTEWVCNQNLLNESCHISQNLGIILTSSLSLFFHRCYQLPVLLISPPKYFLNPYPSLFY